ncbi:hypothetical protein D9Q98_001493 [Chlorella vulgaris]|uniref:Uncharacterized protein n=1 Tax=Chlorella vulgaris TaxID=3077 RepID=A0A9D4U0S3_CHLVU|nr:hypothetical protein D9Q98_001493 [Chlorella vulgaris]
MTGCRPLGDSSVGCSVPRTEDIESKRTDIDGGRPARLPLPFACALLFRPVTHVLQHRSSGRLPIYRGPSPTRTSVVSIRCVRDPAVQTVHQQGEVIWRKAMQGSRLDGKALSFTAQAESVGPPALILPPPIAIPIAEPVTEPVALTLTQPIALTLTQPSTFTAAKPITQPFALSLTLTQRLTFTIAKPISIPITQPQPIAIPIAEPVTEPVALTLTQPLTFTVAKPITQPLPLSLTLTQRLTFTIAKPISIPITQPQPIAIPIAGACRA